MAASRDAGAFLGAEPIAPAVADELEAAARASYTEASMMVVRCARGEEGVVPIRGGRRTVTLGPLGGPHTSSSTRWWRSRRRPRSPPPWRAPRASTRPAPDC